MNVLIKVTDKQVDFLKIVLEDLVQQDLDETGQASNLLLYLETTAGATRGIYEEVEV